MPTTLKFTRHVAASPERVFDVLADFRAYHEWLGRSGSFAETVDVAPDPVCVGTTYLDKGPSGVRHGTVTACDRPRRLAFSQPIEFRAGPFEGRVGIDVGYALEPDAAGTTVIRDVTLAFSGILALGSLLGVAFVKKENERILDALKARVERVVF